MEYEQKVFYICGREVNLSVITDNNIPYYKVQDLAKILNIVNAADMISYVKNEQKKIFMTEKINELGKKIGGKQKTSFITLEATKILLVKSRSVQATELAKQLDIDIISRIIPYECDTLQTIMQVFHGENMKCQYYVNGYRLDLYFIEYRLAIECDESHHDCRNIYDIERQGIIEKELNCTFIRYKPHENNFNINIVLNKIFRHIKFYIKQ